MRCWQQLAVLRTLQAALACAEAQQFLSRHPLTPEEPWMEPWNGGLSSAQMRWLRRELQQAAGNGEQVILASHHPFGKGLPLLVESRPLKWGIKYLCLTVDC